MSLELALRLAGVLQLALAALHLGFPRRFRWKEELARLSLLNRQIFVVHTVFICLVLSMFGALSLFATETLLARSRLALLVLAGIEAFWALRLVFQWFVYDARLWRGQRANTLLHFGFTGLWIYFCAVYGVALARQL